MVVCGCQATGTDSGGARGDEGLSASREDSREAGCGNRREPSSACITIRRCWVAGRALGDSGDRLRTPVHVPQLRGASRISDPAPILGMAGSSSLAAAGAWLQQSAVQWHSPGQQQKYSLAAGPALLIETAPAPANCRSATSRESIAVDFDRVTIGFYTMSSLFSGPRRFGPREDPEANRREKGRVEGPRRIHA